MTAVKKSGHYNTGKVGPSDYRMTASTAARTPGPWVAELDAMMPRGEHWIVHQTDNGLRSWVARISAEMIAPEHGTAKGIAEEIANAHNTHDADRALIAELTAALKEARSAIRCSGKWSREWERNRVLDEIELALISAEQHNKGE